jgi:hypothetical protein
MTTTTPSRAGYDAAVIAYCRSRIELELLHGEIERYHRDDCASHRAKTADVRDATTHELIAQIRAGVFDCDCDGPERLAALLQGDLQVLAILEQWSTVELSASMRKMLDAIAKPFAGRVDFPAQP